MNKASCPYRSAPDSAYWSRSIARVAYDDIDPVVSARFTISRQCRIATAGSCFAQNLSAEIDKRGFNYFVAEPAPGIVPRALARKHGYGVFSARYGNIYTSRQLLQLLYRAYGEFEPSELFWHEPPFWIDPFRPNVQPGGFQSLTEARLDRRAHLAAVRRVVEEADILIFTLGLTEAWESREDGAVFPVCPGCAWGEFSPENYAFRNFTLDEIVSDMSEALGLIHEHNPKIRVILTVSPVPLVATFEPRHVLTSTIYSKSVLRVAVQQLFERFSYVDYFPAYEIITGPATAGHYYSEDRRNVRPEGVRHVMKVFGRHYLEDGENEFLATTPQLSLESQRSREEAEANAIDLVCDEVLLDQDQGIRA